MALLRADIVSTYLAQEMLTTLWYETVPPDPVGIDYIAAARGLGEWVRDNVIVQDLVQNRFVSFLPQNASVAHVSVMAYNPPPLGSVNPTEIINAPQVTQVNALALPGAGPAFAPEAALRLRLLCPSETINPLDYTPAGGYILLGPARESDVFATGEIDGAIRSAMSNFGAALLAQASLGGGFTARPVRVGVSRVGRVPPGVFGWAQVQSVSPAPRVTWRRSRSPR